MARKDVDLVIRAKDEAESVVRSITKALKDFTDAQKSTEAASGKTDTALGKLGAAFGTLQKAVGNGTVGEKIAEEMTKANAAVARLEGSTAKARDELSRLKVEAGAADVALAKLSADTLASAKAQADQAKAVAKAKTEYATLKLEMNSLAQATKGLETQQRQLPEAIAKQETAIAKTVAKLRELEAATASAEQPSQRLADQTVKATAKLTEQQAKLTGLRTALAGVNTKLAASGAAMATFAQKAGAAEDNLTTQVKSLGAIKAAASGLAASTKTAAQAQITTAAAVERLTGQLANEESQLHTAEVGFLELAKAAGMSNDQLGKLSSAGVARLQESLNRQKSVLAGAKEQYQQLSGAASEMAADIGRAGVPTRKMATDFALLQAQVAGSKAVLAEASTAFTQMSQAFRTGGKDLAGLEQIESEFVATQARLSAALKKTTTDYERNATAIRAMNAEQSRGRSGPRALPPVPTAPPLAPWQRLSEAFNKLYGDSRKSLSLTQRLRGEVLSLIAAYGGFYGVVNLLGQVVGAYQTLEAAQSRLNVANSGDLDKSSADMDFLRRTADRLGVELGTLAQEYSKFAISTQGTNLEGEKTRKIFLSVAEAARVNRSSNEEMAGVFVALTQIVSKGAVQMEELRQQLGDRLPGALSIMADGLGVTTAQLIKMMEAGEVTSDALVPFAEELDRRFGPGLGEALAGTTVALGRLKNAAFQALVGFGEAGFIDSFTTLANKLTDLLKTADFAAFLGNASAAFAGLIDVLSVVTDNFSLFIAAVAGFGALKLSPLLFGVITGFGNLKLALTVAAREAAFARSALLNVGAAGATASVGVGRFTAAMKFFQSSTGIGLIITAIGAAIGYWATQADLASQSLEDHIAIVDRVKNAYEEADGSVDDWRKSVGTVTAVEAIDNVAKLEAAMRASKNKLLAAAQNDGETLTQQFFGLGPFVGASQEFNAAVDVVIRKFLSGKITAAQLAKEMDDVSKSFDDGTGANHRMAVALDKATKELSGIEAALELARKILVAVTGATVDAQKAFDELGGKADTNADAIRGNFNKAMEALRGTVDKLVEAAPKAKIGMDDLAKGAGDLEKNYNEALRAAQKLPEAIQRAAAAQDALNAKTEGWAAILATAQAGVDSDFGSYTDGTEAAAAWLRKKELFRADPYPDVNALRAGYGSDTVTLDNGSVVKVTKGMTVTIEQANRDLLRRINTEFRPNAEAASGGRFGSFTAQQQAALISLAYNYGSVPKRVASTIQGGGTIEEIAAAIRGLQTDGPYRPNGDPINRGRRIEEAALFSSTAGYEPAAAAQVKKDEERKKLLEDEAKLRADQQAGTAKTLADGEFEIEQQRQKNAGLERQAEIDAAIRAAREKDPNITQAQIDKITEQTGRVYDLAHAEEMANKPKEAAIKAEETVNNLLSQRNSLQEQLDIAKTAGDNEGATALEAEIAAVNDQLIAAIENAKAMWTAVGGEEADTALAKLEATRMAAVHLSDVAQKNYLDWSSLSDLFVNGLAGAFDSFAKKVAAGEKPLDALRDSFLQFAADFLLQIAQMIIKQAIFNALNAAFGGTSFGKLIGLAHTGGVVGSSRAGSGNGSRRVSPAMFAGAPRYHVGGIVGLQPGEVPIIAKKGEEVLTQNDPRNALNGGRSPVGGPAPSTNVKVINGIDSASFLEAALASPAGEKVILNWLQANSNAVSGSRG